MLHNFAFSYIRPNWALLLVRKYVAVENTNIRKVYSFISSCYSEVWFFRLDALAIKTPEITNPIEAICQALISSPNDSPIMTATIGIKYVTLLAKITDERAIIRLKMTNASAVPITLRITIAIKPFVDSGFDWMVPITSCWNEIIMLGRNVMKKESEAIWKLFKCDKVWRIIFKLIA